MSIILTPFFLCFFVVLILKWRRFPVSYFVLTFIFFLSFITLALSTPKGFYLEIKLSDPNSGLLSGGHSVSYRLLNTSSNATIFQQSKRHYFDNGYTTLYFGPIENEWVFTQPHSVSISINGNSVTLPITPSPYAIQSHVSEKSLSFQDETTIRIVSPNSNVGIGVHSDTEVSEALTISGNLKIIGDLHQIEFFDGLRFISNGSRLIPTQFLWSPYINDGIYSMTSIGIQTTTAQVTDALTVSGSVKISNLTQSSHATTVLLIDSTNSLKTRFIHPILWHPLGTVEIPVGHITANASIDVNSLSSFPYILRVDGGQLDTLVATNSMMTITDLVTPTFSSSLSVINSTLSDLIFKAENMGNGLFINSSGIPSISTENNYSEFTIEGSMSTQYLSQNGYSLLTNSYLSCNEDNFFMGGTSATQFECGNFNTVLGGESFLVSQIGLENTFIGSSIAAQSLSSAHNTALGNKSSHLILSGLFNLSIGHQSSRDNETGYGNIAIGSDSLLLNDTGEYNIAIGRESGRNFTSLGNASADSNISIGPFSAPSNSYGTSNIFIGYGSGNNEQLSNKLFLGSTSPFLYGDFNFQSLSVATHSIRASVNDDSVKLLIEGFLEMTNDLYFIGDNIASNPNHTAMNSGRWVSDINDSVSVTLNSRYNRVFMGVTSNSGTAKVIVREPSLQDSKSLLLEGHIGAVKSGSSIHFGSEHPPTTRIEESQDNSLSIHSKNTLSLRASTLNVIKASNQPSSKIHIKASDLNVNNSLTSVLSFFNNDDLSVYTSFFFWNISSGNNIFYNQGRVLLGTSVLGSETASFYVTNPSLSLFKAFKDDGISLMSIDSNSNLNASTNLSVSNYSVSGSSAKTFIISHPIKPTSYLVHATIESPQTDVYYRGQSELVNGKAIIRLNSYVPSLIDPNSIIVQLTCLNGWSPLSYKLLSPTEIEVSSDTPHSKQSFYWRVIATRKNTEFLVDPLKKDFNRNSIGPYSYATPIVKKEGA